MKIEFRKGWNYIYLDIGNGFTFCKAIDKYNDFHTLMFKLVCKGKMPIGNEGLSDISSISLPKEVIYDTD